jgi:4'-phosphopantetheinyl transferase
MDSLPLPAPAEIHVWLNSLCISGGELALLDPRERERAARFHFVKHRDAFIASHAWLRTLLGRYLGADPAAVEFTFGKHGKPSIEGSPLRFNLSHSGGIAACAVTRGSEVGIDIELIRPIPDLENVARRSFHPEEYCQLLALDERGRTAAFFRSWTRKEAYVKGLGDGLFAPLEPPPADWSLIDLDAGPDYAGAVAVHGRDWVVLSRRGEPF